VLLQPRCIWLLDLRVSFVAMVCGYQLLAAVVCSVCVQIKNKLYNSQKKLDVNIYDCWSIFNS
jgi:hypothetical protein